MADVADISPRWWPQMLRMHHFINHLFGRRGIMKKYILASVGLTVLAGGSAQAADLAVKAPPPLSCAYCEWSGFYIGANVGGAFGHNSTGNTVSLVPPGGIAGVTNPLVNSSYTLSPAGVLGGVQLGWNRQIGRIVWGAEGDWSWTGQKDTVQNQNFFASSVVVAPSALNYSDEQKLSWLATVRGRVGITHDSTLWYLTGGAAFGEVKTNQTFQVTQIVGAGVFGPAAGGASSNSTKAGWTLGGGVETSLAWLGMSNHWSARVEYLYVDLGTVTNSFTVPGALAGTTYTDTNSSKIRDNVVRFGVNYRFGG
jgi:outer membrane immunogenic protein